MSKLIYTYRWANRTYWNIDVDGDRIEINNEKDLASAIALAESIIKSRKKEIEDAPLNAIKSAFSVLMSADISKVDSKTKTDLGAKLASSPAPQSVEPIMDEVK
jgi:hypothetical protein